jgi:hypothetical protein
MFHQDESGPAVRDGARQGYSLLAESETFGAQHFFNN